MELTCKCTSSSKYDSVLKKAKWLIISAYVFLLCFSLFNALGGDKLILGYLGIWSDPTMEEIKHYSVTKSMLHLFLSSLLLIAGFLSLKRFPNAHIIQAAKKLLLGVSINMVLTIVSFILYEFDIIPRISPNRLISMFHFTIFILPIYFYISAYSDLILIPQLKYSVYQLYWGSFIFICNAIILNNLSSFYFFNISGFNSLLLSQVNNILYIFMVSLSYLLIIQGWRSILSTPSDIAIESETPTRFSIAPGKAEWGYLISAILLLALIIIYLNYSPITLK